MIVVPGYVFVCVTVEVIGGITSGAIYQTRAPTTAAVIIIVAISPVLGMKNRAQGHFNINRPTALAHYPNLEGNLAMIDRLYVNTFSLSSFFWPLLFFE